jgi:hypothetical protein
MRIPQQNCAMDKIRIKAHPFAHAASAPPQLVNPRSVARPHAGRGPALTFGMKNCIQRIAADQLLLAAELGPRRKSWC